MILEEAIEFINAFIDRKPGAVVDAQYFMELKDLLQDLRSAELRPALKWSGVGVEEQYKHYLSEHKEIVMAYELWESSPAQYREEFAMEIVDKQMSGETLLMELGYDEHQRREMRRRVIRKNRGRGYFERSD